MLEPASKTEGNSEAKLREMEHRYRSIFENSSEGIFQTSVEGQYLAVNPALARMYGYETPQQLMDSVSDIRTQLYAEANRRAEFSAAMASKGRVVDFISEIFRKDGSRIWIRENAHAVRGPSGEILYYEGWVEDVTEKRRAEEALLRAKLAAEDANRAKSEFLATMSHELRTPLNGILGMTEILLGTKIDADQEDCVRTVQSSAETLLGLVNDALDFSKIEAGRLSLEEIAVSIEEVVDDTLRALAPMAAEKKLPLSIEWGEGVPRTVLGDPLRLRQCISNLVNNAIKFTAKGGVFVRVRFAGEVDSLARIRFEIEDTGVGVAPEVAARLFQPFTQGDASTTRRFGGTGLGLAIVQRLARMMGGEAGLRSHPGIGSIFHFDVLLKSFKAEPTLDQPGVFIVAADAKTASQWSTCFRRAGATICGAVANTALIPIDKLSPKMIVVAAANSELPPLPNPVARVAPVGQASVELLSNPIRMAEVRRLFKNPPASKSATPKIQRVFIADQNPIEQRVLTIQLAKLGLETRLLADPISMANADDLGNASLLLLDCEMRGLDVYDLIAKYRRADNRLKIIGLTEPNSNQAERCRAAGADACLSKPVHPQKLTALLKSERILS